MKSRTLWRNKCFKNHHKLKEIKRRNIKIRKSVKIKRNIKSKITIKIKRSVKIKISTKIKKNIEINEFQAPDGKILSVGDGSVLVETNNTYCEGIRLRIHSNVADTYSPCMFGRYMSLCTR